MAEVAAHAPCTPYSPPPLGWSQHILKSPASLLYAPLLHVGWKREGESKPRPSWGSLETVLGPHLENPVEARETESLLLVATGQANCGTSCFQGNQGGSGACWGPVSRFCFASGTSDLCSKLPRETDATALRLCLIYSDTLAQSQRKSWGLCSAVWKDPPTSIPIPSPTLRVIPVH